MSQIITNASKIIAAQVVAVAEQLAIPVLRVATAIEAVDAVMTRHRKIRAVVAALGSRHHVPCALDLLPTPPCDIELKGLVVQQEYSLVRI